MATTPPPRGRLRTPPAPLCGAGYDNYSPYSCSPRRSKRIATRDTSEYCLIQSQKCTGSNDPIQAGLDGNSHHLSFDSDESPFIPRSPDKSPIASREAEEIRTNSKRQHTPRSLFAKTHTGHNPKNTFTSLQPSHNTMENSHKQISMTAGMLPTPAKTPRKKQIANPEPVARTLFAKSPHNMDSQNRSKGKKYSGFSLESFHGDPQPTSSSSIEIYTDIRDRIPSVNPAEDNPFITGTQFDTPKGDNCDGQSKRRRLSKDKEKRDPAVDEMVKRDDGILYVFRGRKVFRKFTPDDPEESDGSSESGLMDSLDDIPTGRTRPMTRSSIKPRVLFPSTEQFRTRASKADAMKQVLHNTQTDDDEEEEEKEEENDTPEVGPVTPRQKATFETAEPPVTPPTKMTCLETPSTPLASGRSLRSHVKKTEPEITPNNHITPSGNRSSPFDRWTRTKAKSSTSERGKKRTSSTLGRSTQSQSKKVHQSG
ncbi:hypothetical protein LOZ61_006547 [Ophidiomyces ophidiicola]|nr:hypothetical protein LOZ61_006547 [Ophidiomyces ophidiicola]KAI1925923.1 hypothetical protein LOZ60_003812 [Ophidiomyces ophidiicola]KAI2139424.1 hypothetical protein LOZ27_005197 [Ophidiomyces ophidiicola]KAI2160410.1 hypothetical protein LOZ25_002726 [Ophidiomyces ophidiicola]KAI2404085.1 hypothetical protein LOY90_004624 [Ophidiomyces ophidiicola]